MKVIAKHSMNFNGVEYVKWIDDSYLIIAKARLLKQDYTGAHEIFSHVIVYFDKNAYGMDGIILVNRIKPHTDFNSTLESGLIKQMVVGLGKQKDEKR